MKTAGLHWCTFHLGQNVFRHLQDCGKKWVEKYVNDADFNVAVRCLSALAHLPPEDISDAFDDLLEDYTELPDELVEYFAKTYIGTVVKKGRKMVKVAPMYEPELWSVHERIVKKLPRSNNTCEGYHHALSNLMNGDKPNVWKYIETIQKYYALAEKKLVDHESGHLNQSRKKYREITKRIENITESYNPAYKVDTLKSIARLLCKH